MNNDLMTFNPDSIAATLNDLPKSLYDSDLKIAQAEQSLVELIEAQEIAEINVSLNANPDGKNSEVRALQVKAALTKDLTVLSARAAVNGAKGRIEIEKVNNKMLSRQFAGMCHIAELRAAQMNLISKGQSQ